MFRLDLSQSKSIGIVELMLDTAPPEPCAQTYDDLDDDEITMIMVQSEPCLAWALEFFKTKLTYVSCGITGVPHKCCRLSWTPTAL